VLAEERVQELIRKAEERPGYELTVDLEQQALYDADGFREPFEVDPFVRERLLNGLDDIGLTLKLGKEISAFEAERPGWLTPAGE
jgi:3-isopropylmalate/(R)-2-methylmalate dehydratase small subunit